MLPPPSPSPARAENAPGPHDLRPCGVPRGGQAEGHQLDLTRLSEGQSSRVIEAAIST